MQQGECGAACKQEHQRHNRGQGLVRMVQSAEVVVDGAKLLLKKRWKRQQRTVQENDKLIKEVFNAQCSDVLL